MYAQRFDGQTFFLFAGAAVLEPVSNLCKIKVTRTDLRRHSLQFYVEAGTKPEPADESVHVTSRAS